MKQLLTVWWVVCLSVLILWTGVVSGQATGSIVAWGGMSNEGQWDVPAPNADFVAVSAGSYHGLGLKSDGTIVTWGRNSEGQCDVPAPNAGFVAAAGGSYYSLGLKSDRTIVSWGQNSYGQCDVPAPNADFVVIAAGYNHSLGIKSDGTIVAWGWNDHVVHDVPAPNADFVAVAGGVTHSLGLKSNGTIVAWGDSGSGKCDVPTPNADFVAIACGAGHSLGLKSDETIVAWGINSYGQCDFDPTANFVAVAGGFGHSLGLRTDGTIVVEGTSIHGQRPVPLPNANFVAVAAQYDLSLGLKGTGIEEPLPVDPDMSILDLDPQDTPLPGLMTCPAGDAPAFEYLKVVARDSGGTPLAHVPSTSFVFTSSGGDVSFTVEEGATETDVTGTIHFSVTGNEAIPYGPEESPSRIYIEVSVGTVPLSAGVYLQCNTPDYDLDGDVDPVDFGAFAGDFGVYMGRSDFDWTGPDLPDVEGVINPLDFARFALHFSHGM